MDYISSILHPDHTTTDELSQFSSIPCQQHTIPQDKFSIKSSDDLTTKTEHSQPRRKSSVAFGVKDENLNESKKKKKTIHRDIERQRRQEMTTLYTSLRSLLPLEYIKGKRSISDQIHEAVNYIKHQEDKIQELRNKRDELKKLSISSSPSSALEGLESCNKYNLTVRPCWGGVEVIIDTASTNGLPLSRVLQILIEEGLSIVSCISTTVNERMLHSIISEVSDGRSIDVSEIQKKLTNSVIWSTN